MAIKIPMMLDACSTQLSSSKHIRAAVSGTKVDYGKMAEVGAESQK